MSGAATKWRYSVDPLSLACPAWRGVTIPGAMGFADLWSRTLVYFGIAEEDDYWDEDGYATNEELERTYNDRPNVRRLPRRRRGDYDDWTDSDTAAGQVQVAAPPPSRAAREQTAPARPRRLEAAPSPNVKVHLVLPRSFNDAQQIADRFKDGIPVILNLQSTDQELSKRLIDFASGLTYALNGGMQRVADKVFLLTPRNVEVSAEERARLLERGGFFNQA
jgi:cell division inhibitor SepF